MTRPSGDRTGGPLINTGFAVAVVLVVESTATAVADEVEAIMDTGFEV